MEHFEIRGDDAENAVEALGIDETAYYFKATRTFNGYRLSGYTERYITHVDLRDNRDLTVTSIDKRQQMADIYEHDNMSGTTKTLQAIWDAVSDTLSAHTLHSTEHNQTVNIDKDWEYYDSVLSRAEEAHALKVLQECRKNIKHFRNRAGRNPKAP